jgi:nicotinate-nucleotide adenylyltransferase
MAPSDASGATNAVGTPVAMLGGTFDPVHYGHLRFAEDVRRALELPEVRLVPAGDPPHRAGPAATAADRLAMLQLAVTGFPGIVVDERELRRPGKSYTVLTLEELRREFPRRPLLLLLGADAFRGLPSWHRWHELFGLAHLVVVERPGVDLAAGLPAPLLPYWRERLTADAEDLRSRLSGFIYVQAIAPHNVAATTLREALARGEPTRGNLSGLLPPAVLAYIDLHHLYRPGSDAPE